MCRWWRKQKKNRSKGEEGNFEKEKREGEKKERRWILGWKWEGEWEGE